MIENTSFLLTLDDYTEVFQGTGNKTKLNYKPVGSYRGVTIDANGHLDFTANNCTRIDIKVGDETISTADGFVTFDGGNVYVEFGAFTFIRGSQKFKVLAFFGADTTKGVMLSHNKRLNFNEK